MSVTEVQPDCHPDGWQAPSHPGIESIKGLEIFGHAERLPQAEIDPKEQRSKVTAASISMQARWAAIRLARICQIPKPSSTIQAMPWATNPAADVVVTGMISATGIAVRPAIRMSAAVTRPSKRCHLVPRSNKTSGTSNSDNPPVTM